VTLRATVSQYRWPIYLGGLLVMSVLAHGILVYVATRPDTPRPMPDFYERAMAWDADAAVQESSRQLGWAVTYRLPQDTPHTPGMPRPVDLEVRDADGEPLRDLEATLFAVRPSDSRLNQSGDLTELPHDPGHYRALLRLDHPGLWEFHLEARRGALRFVHDERFTLAPAGLEAAAP